jgi:ABC-2 type transport system ATP-binding protein
MSTWKVSVQAAILKPLKNVITIMNIIIENLRKNFGEKTAVNINQFEIPSGQILGLVGNNGAGKSTLFRLMLDLIKADEGRVLMGITDVSQTEEWKSWTGAFVDESFLIDYLTPDEYFQFVARISGTPDEEYQSFLARFEHFMAGELMGQNKLIRNLSAGNKQKVGIVAAMLLRPKVLILDEPFNFLDPSSQSAIKNLLLEYNRETGATILVSSHNLQHTVDISPRIALLENGVIIRDIDNADGKAQEELENYFKITD